VKGSANSSPTQARRRQLRLRLLQPLPLRNSSLWYWRRWKTSIRRVNPRASVACAAVGFRGACARACLDLSLITSISTCSEIAIHIDIYIGLRVNPTPSPIPARPRRLRPQRRQPLPQRSCYRSYWLRWFTNINIFSVRAIYIVMCIGWRVQPTPVLHELDGVSFGYGFFSRCRWGTPLSDTDGGE